MDDLGLTALTTQQAQELLEVIEERNVTGSIIVTSQLPVKEWYSYFKNPTLARRHYGPVNSQLLSNQSERRIDAKN